MAALVFPKLFFPKDDPLTGTLNNYAIFFVGFLARPVGAWLFGTYGDRIGRKATLIATLLFMGIATFLIGIMPTYSSIGLWAAVILVILRLCQGIGVGGEWGGSVLMSMEWGSQKRKGFLGSWPQFGVPVGLLLSTAITALTVTLAGSATFEAWAWRVPFLLSILLVGVGLYIRLGILETPVFRAIVQEQRIESRPIAEVVSRNWREIILSALLRLPEQAPFYLFTTFVFTFGLTATKLGRPFLTWAVSAAAIVSFFTIPLFGHLSDRLGRKHVLVAGWIAAIPVPFLLGWAPTWNWILIANALLGVSQGLTWSTTVIMKIDLVGSARRGLAMGLNEVIASGDWRLLFTNYEEIRRVTADDVERDLPTVLAHIRVLCASIPSSHEAID